MSAQPIPTRYAGCHFRSRLEARWAVFMDTLGVPWEYEPQGFEWPAGVHDGPAGPSTVDGGRYLPDFWLPTMDTWFEVKGAKPSDEEWRLIGEFAVVTGARHITTVGDIPRHVGPGGPEWPQSGFFDEPMFLNHQGWDCCYAWCICPCCGTVGIEFDARAERICRKTEADTNTGNHPRLLAAYTAARSARFEHGESGAT